MKKITLLLFTFLAVTLGFSQNGGDDCASAVAITPGSFTATTITAASAGGEMGGGGNDSAWFSYTPAASGTMNIFSCLGGDDTRLWIGTGACGTLTSIADNDDACEMTAGGNAYASALYGVVVTAGTTYYIEWDDRWSEGPFDWTLEFQACVAPTATAAVVDDCGNNQFTIDVDVTDMGSATTLTLSNDYDANTVNVTGTGIWTAGPFPLGTNVVVTLEHDTDAACNIFSGTLTDTCPPDNDDCANAIDASALPYTNFQNASGATNNAGFITACANTMNDGVWYMFTPTVSGTVTINITNVTGWDPQLDLYSGSCGTLTCVDSADSGGTGGSESLTDMSVVAGTTYYVNVGYFSGFTDGAEGPFQIDITEVTLGLDDFKQNSFTYFPNPVNDKLSLRAQNNIQTVSVFNILGQEVVRMAPNTVSSTVDMSQLNNGAYFVKVTINDKTETIKIMKQ